MSQERHEERERGSVAPTRARQGVIGHHVIVVLAVSLTLAVVAAVLLYGWFATISPGSG